MVRLSSLIRRPIGLVVGMWLAIGAAFAPTVARAEGGGAITASAVLDLPRADVAVLDGSGPDGAPRLFVVDPMDPDRAMMDLTVLERDGTWGVATTTRLDLGRADGDDFAPPILIGLGRDRFAVLTTSAASGGSRIVTVEVTTDPVTRVARIEEEQRLRLGRLERAGAADVDGDGIADLVVATTREPDVGSSCPRTRLHVYPAGDLGRPWPTVVTDVAMGPGVVGQFDDEPGDDLAVYGWSDCSDATPLAPLELVAYRLADGTAIGSVPAGNETRPPTLPPPVRLDIDGDRRHELLGQGPRGLSIVDPRNGWDDIRVASRDAIPLGEALGPERVVWLEPATQGRPSIGAEAVRRTADGILDSGPATVRWDLVPPTLAWEAAEQTTRAAAERTLRPVAWRGVVDDPACADLFVPNVRLTCAGERLEDGPTWIASRPVLAFDDVADGGRRVLVAAGLTWPDRETPPITPDPWGDGSGGRWRAPDGATFALTEVPAATLSAPGAGGSIAADPVAILGPAARVRADPGTRLAIGVVALRPGAPSPATAVDPLAPEDVGGDVVISLRRIPMMGTRDGALPTIEVPLGWATLAGAPADRWALLVTRLDDLGRITAGQRFEVRHDTTAPVVQLDAPFVSPPWPFTARLVGRTEPGTTVTLAGARPVTADLTGAFTIETQLAPWPQRLSIGATDGSRNVSTLELSVVGGVDYRAFPWAAIGAAALIVAAAVSGLVGSRRRQANGATATPDLAMADGSGPELEELPPGSAL